jgi:hypothetical protein
MWAAIMSEFGFQPNDWVFLEGIVEIKSVRGTRFGGEVTA